MVVARCSQIEKLAFCRPVMSSRHHWHIFRNTLRVLVPGSNQWALGSDTQHPALVHQYCGLFSTPSSSSYHTLLALHWNIYITYSNVSDDSYNLFFLPTHTRSSRPRSHHYRHCRMRYLPGICILQVNWRECWKNYSTWYYTHPSLCGDGGMCNIRIVANLRNRHGEGEEYGGVSRVEGRIHDWYASLL
jgi:hypothetical protein